MSAIRDLFAAAALGIGVGGALAYGVYLSQFGLASTLAVVLVGVVVLLLVVQIVVAALIHLFCWRWRKAGKSLIGVACLFLTLFVARAAPMDVRFAAAKSFYAADLAAGGNPARKIWTVDEDLYGANATYLIYDKSAGSLPPERSDDGCSIYTERVDPRFYLETHRC